MVLLFIMKVEPHLTRHLQKILNMKEIPEQADKKEKENPGKRQKAKSQLNKEYQYTMKRILIRLSMQRASLVAQLVKNPPAMWETWVQSLVCKIPWRREWLQYNIK